MLKPFIVSFILTLTMILLLTYPKSSSSSTDNVIEEANPLHNVLQLENQKSCDNIKATADIIFGEGENQTLENKYALAKFLVSESIKNNRTLCQELKYRMPGGALKYSSMYDGLNKLKQARKTSYAKILEEAQQFWDNEEVLDYEEMSKYSHYITTKLAVTNPPAWFKYYITRYKIYGDHVFIDVDFSNKHEDRKTGKYLANYRKLVKEIKSLS